MVNTINIEDFADLKRLTVDKSKPKQERLKKFIEDVKNPYTVRVGDILVQIKFAGGKDFLNALSTVFLM